MTNPRQRELEQQQKNVILLAKTYVNQSIDAHENPYTKIHDLDFFLAQFRTSYFASEYASKRYFKDFETIGYFSSLEKKFTINSAIRNNRFRIAFPEPETTTTTQTPSKKSKR